MTQKLFLITTIAMITWSSPALTMASLDNNLKAPSPQTSTIAASATRVASEASAISSEPRLNELAVSDAAVSNLGTASRFTPSVAMMTQTPSARDNSLIRGQPLWLLLAIVLMGLAIYEWRKPENAGPLFSSPKKRLTPKVELEKSEPSVDIDQAFSFYPGPLSAPLGGVGLARPVSTYCLFLPKSGERVLLRSGVISIGSAPNNTIVLNELGALPKHAEIYILDGQCEIRNIGYNSETTINGRPLTTMRTTLKLGDTIIIGRTILVLKKVALPAHKPRYRESIESLRLN